MRGEIDGRTRSRRLQGSDRAGDTDDLLRGFKRAQERRNLGKATIASRRQKLLLLAEHVHPVSLVAVTREQIEDFLDPRPLGPRARYTYISHFHAFYEWALLEGLVGEDPTMRIQRPRLPRLSPRPIRTEELERALALAPPVEKAMITLAAFQGLRAKEIAGLMREDVLEHQDPRVLIVASGKGGHQRVLPLHERTLPALRVADAPAAGYVFTRPNKDALYPHEVSHRINRYLHDLGIESSAHSLRHWFGTNVFARCKDLRVTQELMGHASPNTTVAYVAFSGVAAHDAVRGLDVG